MEYLISHEVRFEIKVEAASKSQAEELAVDTPYSGWEEKYVVREDCIPLGESPINPYGH